METQTPYEVIKNLITSGPAERMGLRDSPWADTLKKWITQGYPVDAEGNAIPPVEHFNFDMGSGGAWFPWIAKQIDDEMVEETDEWKLVKDGNGATFKWWKHKSGTPEHFAFEMTSRAVWEREYKPYVVGSVKKRATTEAIENARETMEKRAGDRWLDFGFRGLWENMRAAFGDIALYENMLLDPDWITDYCRTYTDLYLEELEISLGAGAKPDGIWFFDDLGYKQATFCSPDLYGKLVFPFYEELIGYCHDHGLQVILHTCGYTEPVLDLIVNVGFDGVNPLEVKAGNDIVKIADTYADKLLFVGGLDARVLETHDRDLIRREIGTLLEELKKRNARFVFGSDHSLSTLIDYDDFRFAIDVYREHMYY